MGILDKIFKKKKTDTKNTIEGAGLPMVHVVVCRPMNKTTVTEVLEFDAIQKKNEDYNFFIINEEHNFKQEIDFERHYIIELLNYKLGLMSLSKEKKLETINQKIRDLEIEKSKAKDGKVGEERINIIDIDNDLNHLAVLKYYVNYEAEGSFEIINKNGQREMRFLARNGVYYPYFFHSDTDNGKVIDIVSDKALKQKYYRETDSKIEERFLQNQSGNFWTGIKGTIITIVIGALVLALIGSLVEINKARSEIGSELLKCESKCTDKATDCSYYYTKLIEDEIINRSIDVSTISEGESKKTGTLVDLTKKMTG